MRTLITSLLVCLAVTSLKAADIRVGPVHIKVLDVGESQRSGGGPSSSSNVKYVYTTNHCFAYVFLDEDQPDQESPTHVLVIDGVSFGSIPEGADVRFGANRLWVNGESRAATPMPENLKEEMYRGAREPFNLSLMGLSQDYEILCHDSAGFGRGAAGNADAASYFDGQFVVRIKGDRLIVWGVDFGQLQVGDKVEVFPKKVHVNGELRFPVQQAMAAPRKLDFPVPPGLRSRPKEDSTENPTRETNR